MATVKDGDRFSQLNLVSIWGSSKRLCRSSDFDFDETTLVGSEVSHSLRVKVEIYVFAFSLKIDVNLRYHTLRLTDLTNLKLYGKFKVMNQTTSLWFKLICSMSLTVFVQNICQLECYVVSENVNFRFNSLIFFAKTDTQIY